METTKPTFGQWISVKDRLPDNGTSVIIIRFNNGMFFEPDIAGFLNGEFVPDTSLSDDVEFNDKWITHWMPLPEPPKL